MEMWLNLRLETSMVFNPENDSFLEAAVEILDQAKRDITPYSVQFNANTAYGLRHHLAFAQVFVATTSNNNRSIGELDEITMVGRKFGEKIDPEGSDDVVVGLTGREIDIINA